MVVLFMPNFILKYTTIYSINAEGYVAFDAWQRSNPWLYYSFSLLELPCVLYGIFSKKKKDDIYLIPLVVFIVFWNIARLLLSSPSIFSFGQIGDYSVLLSLLSGYGCYLLLKNVLGLHLEDALDLIIILNFITQILFVITGRVNEYGGRYPALGSTVGDLGTICFLYIIYYCFARTKKKHNLIPIFCCFTTLILSGSRANILFTIIFLVIFLFKLPREFRINKNKGKAFFGAFALLFFAGIAFLMVSSYSNENVFDRVLTRSLDFISSIFGQNRSEYFETDASFTQRLLSINVGFKIIGSNPFGISASPIELQMQTISNGYYTFPHSAVLSYYLLWSFGCIAVIYWLLRYIVLGIKKRNTHWIVLFCFLISNVVYGAPITNSKLYFWLITLFALCKKEIIEAKETNPSNLNSNRRIALNTPFQI